MKLMEKNNGPDSEAEDDAERQEEEYVDVEAVEPADNTQETEETEPAENVEEENWYWSKI